MEGHRILWLPQWIDADTMEELQDAVDQVRVWWLGEHDTERTYQWANDAAEALMTALQAPLVVGDAPQSS